MKRILFVCTGNTCRSPMAEALARKLAKDQGMELEFRSAGTSAWDGQAVSEYTMQVLREQGISEELFSSSLSYDLVQWADLILTMTQSHKGHVIQRYADAVNKTYTLKEYVDNDPATLEKISEGAKFAVELQLKQALGEPITAEEREKLAQIVAEMPLVDIVDPFGSSLETYRQCGAEIRGTVKKLLNNLSQLS